MAEGFPRTEDLVRCSECHHEIDVDSYDLEDYEYEVQAYLHENTDLYGMYECRSELDPIIQEVPITVQCNECDADIEVNVEVEAEPVWSEEDLESDKDPKVDYFDITWYGNVSFEEHLGENLDIHGFDRLDSIREINLRIICKTRMNNGYCYIGYDENDGRLLRPIFRTQRGQCYWPGSRDFEIGASYTFNVLHHPDIPSAEDPPTPFPHQNDDLVVSEEIRNCASRDSWSVNFLENIACTRIGDIFPEHFIRENKFIDENTNCPSVGILKTSERNLRVFENDYGKRRLRVSEGYSQYNFPVTGLQFDQPDRDGARKALVLLGLGRPYAGSNNEFQPSRCYILVLGIFLY